MHFIASIFILPYLHQNSAVYGKENALFLCYLRQIHALNLIKNQRHNFKKLQLELAAHSNVAI